MVTLSIEFLAGRYHATSWDHHVNEGTVEWPPSPWRLARALLATSYRLDDLSDELRRRVLEPLLGEPVYAVPPATIAHTRHYMPTDDKPTKVLDTFVVPSGALEIQWRGLALTEDDAAVLDRVLRALTYLGRAESWVEVRRIPALTAVANCVPAADGSLELWATQHPDEYRAWRTRWESEQAQLPRKERREVPADQWQVIHVATSQLLKDGWSRPPGTRRVRYRFAPVEGARRTRARAARSPTVARFELSSAVPPRLTEALPVGERVRMALLAWSDGHLVFVGRNRHGEIEQGHPHAWFLPADDDADGRLDHLLVYARDGFDRSACRALERVRRVWGHGGHDVDLVLVALGDAGEIGGLRRHAQQRATAPQLGPASIWESHTPFVPPRHVKRRGGRLIDTPPDQVARLLAAQGLPTCTIEALDARALASPRPPIPVDWFRFRRTRTSGGGRRGAHGAFGFRLRFDREVIGPIAVGYAAHQGLGQFVAIE